MNHHLLRQHWHGNENTGVWTARARQLKVHVIAGLLTAFLVAGCGNSGADLSKIGAATYRGPTATTVKSGGTPGAIQSSANNRTNSSSDTKTPPTQPIEPRSLEPGAEAAGNGFYIDDKGHILTTWQQVRSCRRVAVLDNFELVHVSLIGGSSLNALAVLDSKKPSPVHATIRASAAVPGEKVRALSYPIVDGMFMSVEVAHGVVKSLTGPQGIKGILQTTAVSSGQSSGGPLVGKSDEVIGIVVKKLASDWPSGIGYSVSSELIQQFLASVNVDVLRLQSVASADTSSQNAGGRYPGDYMVPIICFR